jgi:general secretion pathway protein J
MVLTALATVTALWLPNWNRGFAAVQRSELLATGLERLMTDLSSAEFVSVGRGAVTPAFDGTQLSVTFVRTELGPNAANGLELVRIGESSDDRGRALVRMRAPFLPTNPNSNPNQASNFGDPVVVMRAPFRASFSYAGPDRVWRDTWQGAAQLPRAIRVTIRDEATGRILSVSTSTSVHVDIPARCITVKTAAECLSGAEPSNPAPDATTPRDLNATKSGPTAP